MNPIFRETDDFRLFAGSSPVDGANKKGKMMFDTTTDMLTGRSCSWCGLYFEKKHGHPVICVGCWRAAKPRERLHFKKATEKEL